MSPFIKFNIFFKNNENQRKINDGILILVSEFLNFSKRCLRAGTCILILLFCFSALAECIQLFTNMSIIFIYFLHNFVKNIKNGKNTLKLNTNFSELLECFKAVVNGHHGVRSM